MFLLLLPSPGTAEVRNIVVFFDGSTAITLIDSIEFDSLKYIDRDSGDTLRIAKKEAYFVYPQSLRNVARVIAFRNFLYSKVSKWEF